MANDTSQRDIVLDIGTYAFIRDRTGGAIKIGTGPNTITPSQSDEPVKFDSKTGRFVPCTLDSAVLLNVTAKEGSYIVLENPSSDQKQPKPEMKGVKADVALNIGSKLVIPGPADFPLWPRQSADVIEGHQLKSNQFLLCRVYNETLAKENWSKAIVRKAAPATPVAPPPPGGESKGTDGEQTATTAQAETPKVEQADATKLAVGQLFIVKGTDVSFYIPPSGIEVLRDEQNRFVRDALTLERMEYCILVDENGEKRYEKGPQVVFPMPTEKFQVKDGAQKQSAIELNDLQGLHLKAIANCEYNKVELGAGQEYFLTGDGLYNKEDSADELDTMKGQQVGDGVTIYYPREEIAFVKYDGKTKIFAVTVPEGEGRYVMNRNTGEIHTVRGPKQLLPNPCKYVIVRRALSDKECTLLYPGNYEALAYNQGIRGVMTAAPTTRAGAISEGDYERALKGRTKSLSADSQSVMRSAVMNFAGETSRVSGDQKVMGDEFERSSGYTAPRTLTLNTKYQGAVLIKVWTGYAVEVVSTNKRRVVEGPATILLDYDEMLSFMELSTNKPKTTDNLLQTAYLRVKHNKVSDKVRVKTAEGIDVDLYFSYKINFTGDSSKWFMVDNYVKFFCDHARSLLKGAVRKLRVEDFYLNYTELIRDILLGKVEGGKRPGLLFEENGMFMDDFEILDVTISDPNINKMLFDVQLLAVRSNIELLTAKRNLEVTTERAKLSVMTNESEAAAAKRLNELAIESKQSSAAVVIAELDAEINKAEKRLAVVKAEEEIANEQFNARMDRDDAEVKQEITHDASRQDLVLAKVKADTDAVVEKLKAFQEGYGQIFAALGDREIMVKLAEAQNWLRIVESSDKANELVGGITGLKSLKDLIKNGLSNGAGTGIAKAAPQPQT